MSLGRRTLEVRCLNRLGDMWLKRDYIFGIAAGYEDANDHDTLRHDPAFQVAAGRTPAQND